MTQIYPISLTISEFSFMFRKPLATSINHHHMSNTIKTNPSACIFCLGFQFANSATCCSALSFMQYLTLPYKQL
jgi:hypothetical protein